MGIWLDNIFYRKKLTTLYYVMDGELRMEKNIGYFKIVGELNGENLADLGKMIIIVF